VLTAAAMNLVQEEIARAVESSGLVPSDTAYSQLTQALRYTQMRTALRNTSIVATGTGAYVQDVCGMHTMSQTINNAYLVSATTIWGVAACQGGKVALLLTSGLYDRYWVTSSCAGGYVGNLAGCLYDPVGHAYLVWGATGEVQSRTPDGGVWVSEKTGGSAIRGLAVHSTLGTVCAADSDGDLWTAPAYGGTYTEQSAMFTTSVQKMAYGNGIWCAADGSYLTHQTAGNELVSWTATPTPATGVAVDICYSSTHGKFFAVTGRQLISSADCVTWIAVGETGAADGYTSVCEVDGCVIAQSKGGARASIVSPDGVTAVIETSLLQTTNGVRVCALPDKSRVVCVLNTALAAGEILQSPTWAY
jgi:hypothetical protein